MKNYHIKATENTPEVILNAATHEMIFRGEARPEDTRMFYTPILQWLDDYFNYLYFVSNNEKEKESSKNIVITCHFQLEYFNSSSAKFLMDFLTKLHKFTQELDNVTLKIYWHYEEMDEDMLDAGKEFSNMLAIPFEFVVIN